MFARAWRRLGAVCRERACKDLRERGHAEDLEKSAWEKQGSRREQKRRVLVKSER